MERSISKAEEFIDCENTFVVEVDHKVVGFSNICESRDQDTSNCGEIQAIYILKKYHRRCFGRKLVFKAVDKLRRDGFELVSLWVLSKNKETKKFYELCGFTSDGNVKEHKLGEIEYLDRYVLKI
ncbi:GNAT family N-acetyltransferase [Mycoplasmatota bacterium WC44]